MNIEMIAGGASLAPKRWSFPDEGNPELIELAFHLAHERLDTRRDRAEVMIFELLSLGRLATKQSAAGHDEIGAQIIERAINEEIFLFGAQRRHHALDAVHSDHVQE